VVVNEGDGSIRVRNLDTGAQVATLRNNRGYVMHAAFSPDVVRVVTIGAEPRIWDAKSGESLALLSGHTAAIRSATFKEVRSFQ
jgi:WD40 repeat protein